MYESLIMLDPDVDITPEQLAAELRRFYENKVGAPGSITVSGDTVVLQWRSYKLEVGRSSFPEVAEESAEIAREFGAGHPAQDRIARCHTRFELSGDDDPDMVHFNDCLFVGEALLRLGRVYRFDQASAEFIE